MKHGNHTQDRRDFLKKMAVLAGGAALAPALRVIPAFAASSLAASTEQRMLMGTIVGLTVMTPTKAQGEEAIGLAFEEINRLIGIFSRFDSGTALSALNSNGRLSGSPQELLQVLEHGSALHKQSGGRFDMTIAPVVNLMERTNGRPDPKDLSDALALVDSSRLSRHGRDITFNASGMEATLDGIAKGFIADSASEILKTAGVSHFMVDAGGDIRVQGSPKGDGRPWRIAIEDPDKNGDYPSIIEMRSGAVATSGGYEVYFDKSRKSTHLINPETGASPQYIKSVSVQAPTVMQADGLATALSIMSPREALRLTSSLPDHSCLLVTSTGARLASSNWG
jgi:thiamine biosynthesis lipoprotein